MSHIFGLEHSIGGILGQLGSIAGPASPLQMFSPGPVPSTTSGVMPVTGGGTLVAGTSPCSTTRGGKPKEYQIITTVHSDGTTTTKSVCKTRKRRRRLATTSDIRDLAALKSILGGGKAFDTWIATRGR